MANPYILRSIGGGALAGGATGAATGDNKQTSKQRLGRGILGAMGGSVLGGLGHTGLRYNALRKATTPEISGNKVVQKTLGGEKALEEALLGSDSVKAFKNRSESDTKALKEFIGEGLSEDQFHAREAAKRTKEIVDSFNDSNMFYGMDSQAAKKAYRKAVMPVHPDRFTDDMTEAARAANTAKFDDISKQYKAFQEAQGLKKSASTLMFENCFYFLRNNLY